MARDYIVIGATSGIGASIARRLMDRGDRVHSISRSESGPVGAAHIRADVVEDEIDTAGLPENCAGLVYCPGSINLRPFRSLKVKDFEKDMNINVYGAIKTIKALLPKLNKEDSSIVMFSTVAVQQGMPFHASVAAAKGAVEGLTRSLAAEFAPGIRVNCIAPSLTDTPMAARLLGNDARREASEQRHPLKRIGSPDDIAGMATVLLSPEGNWMSGQIIGIDGGMSALRV